MGRKRRTASASPPAGAAAIAEPPSLLVDSAHSWLPSTFCALSGFTCGILEWRVGHGASLSRPEVQRHHATPGCLYFLHTSNIKISIVFWLLSRGHLRQCTVRLYLHEPEARSVSHLCAHPTCCCALCPCN